jgi:hypothetical protein
MGTKDYARTKRELELKQLRTFARIEEAEDGGPIIDLITGREPHPVGAKCCIKSGMRALQWESMRAELPMIEMCEVASPVHSMMTQPHELFMKVTGQERMWMYRPDMRLKVDVTFADDLRDGTSFQAAVRNWRPGQGPDHLVDLIVEVKHPKDPRYDDPIYDRKLDLARQVYEALGWRFARVEYPEQVAGPSIARSVRELALDHDTSLSPADLDVVRRVMGPDGSARLGDLSTALARRHKGLAKCAALHVRRIISIDLEMDLLPETTVLKMPDHMAIFEMRGVAPW